MASNDDVWVVVPLHNEVTVIDEVVTDLLDHFPHVLCVDDGSTDGSGDMALAAGAAVATHPINLGQGAALQTGFDYVLHSTDATYVVTFDADGQHRVEDAEAMVSTARAEDLAIVFGSRFLDGTSEVGRLRRIILRTAALVTRLRTGLHLTDAHNGLRLIRRDALCAVNLDQNRMAHATQVVNQLAATGLPWREVPVHIRYTDYSRSKGQSLLNSVNILVELVLG
ncbi:glycosyltransferase family 2 protein [Actinomyces polynesiensis]|uniref:glycosyltransferase family 2 protein n=1 Tax=Actinomyces polynesiensis TaxID=1325934 RepID=UPI0006941A29|nr:glycosyltransferase family 2 protein [Actinomyces polynesiensis]